MNFSKTLAFFFSFFIFFGGGGGGGGVRPLDMALVEQLGDDSW